MLIVDPSQHGVTAALSSLNDPPTFVVGRIDLKAAISELSRPNDVEKIKAIVNVVIELMGPRENIVAYNGILITNWEGIVEDKIFSELIKFLDSLSLNVYMEVAPPMFISTASFPVSHLAGIVFVNGSIMSNGERRDYPNFIGMKKALDIATKESFFRDFTIMMCEIIDDDAALTNAVLTRSFKWCAYLGALVWIGRHSALSDASKWAPVPSPDSAFSWLKNDRVVEVHDKWRLNCKAKSPTVLSDNRSPGNLWTTLPNMPNLTIISLVSSKPSS